MSPYERCCRADQQSKVEAESHDGACGLSMLGWDLPAGAMGAYNVIKHDSKFYFIAEMN